MKFDDDLVQQLKDHAQGHGVPRPRWCPASLCIPIGNDLGPDAIGTCTGFQCTPVPDTLNCVRLCANDGSKELHKLIMTIDEAARLGGLLSYVAGCALLVITGWKQEVDKIPR